MAADPDPNAPRYPPPDRSSPQLTIRSILTGMVLGGVLSVCNIYSGLKIGWSFNMSITSVLLSYGFWQLSHKLVRTRPWGMLENNVNQAAGSAAANISSAGLVSAVPALTLLTGEKLSWPALAVWTFSVSLVGIAVAVGVRKQMLLVDKLPFPSGIATAETLREMYSVGSEALARIRMLLAGGVLGASTKLLAEVAKLKPLGLPGALTPAAGSQLSAAGVHQVTLGNLGFSLDPSLLMVGMGAIIGFRAAWSMLLGALIAWGLLGPWVLDLGWAKPGKPDAAWFGPMNTWMLWPGVALMVTASLTSFAFSWRSVLGALRGTRAASASPDPSDDVPRVFFIGLVLVSLLLATLTQLVLFPIRPAIAVGAVLFTFVLAIVAGRVSGETGISPIGPMGKVTQLVFGVLSPANPAANLMAANVTGGAASQTADLLHDLKTGLLIGASPRKQTIGQIFGVISGALIGTAAYLVLVPDPRAMLLTDEWPAPAVAAWKAVAELFARGIETMPQGALDAMVVAGVAGVALAIVEKLVPEPVRRFVPSPAALGIAMVIPAWYAMSVFIGGAIAVALGRFAPRWASRFIVVLASGIVAGESLAGVGVAIQQALSYLGGAARP